MTDHTTTPVLYEHVFPPTSFTRIDLPPFLNFAQDTQLGVFAQTPLGDNSTGHKVIFYLR